MKPLVLFPVTNVQRVLLGALPFLLLALAYVQASNARLDSNPDDRVLPAASQMAETFIRYAAEPDRRSGDLLLWSDTAASLQRLSLGVGISGVIALFLGVLGGLLPPARAPLSPFISALSLVPPLALLPILFVSLGVGEVAKVALITLGTAPYMTRELEARVRALPQEQIVKALTLGASSWQIAIRIVLPQILPRLLDAIRLSLGAAWLFLIAAEAIASTDGLGYRIFLVRRYLAMDVILPYVMWITLLAILFDILLKQLTFLLFPWYRHQVSGGASS